MFSPQKAKDYCAPSGPLAYLEKWKHLPNSFFAKKGTINITYTQKIIISGTYVDTQPLEKVRIMTFYYYVISLKPSYSIIYLFTIVFNNLPENIVFTI